MKKNLKQFLMALCLLVAPLGIEAQSLVFHLAGGNKTTVTLPATFTVTPTDGKLVIAVQGSDNVELSKDDVMCVTYREAKGDVNGDQRVDVADITTLVALLLGKDTEEQAYTSCPDDHHPHMIDLGLPSGTKWACCNVGASAPEQYGDYYAWGETSPKSVYNWDTYQYGYYNYDGDYSHLVNIGSDIAGTGFDAATANWGAPWRMPSKTQIQELVNSCTSTWTTQNGVNGREFVGPNGGTIFLPAAGGRWDSDLYGAGSAGYYWSSTLDESSPYNAYYLYFNSGSASWGYDDRYGGLSVRPVR